MTNRRSSVVLGFVCVAFTGCASAASSPPSYVAAGNAICSARLAQLNKLAQPTTPAQAVSYLPEAVASLQRETGELGALSPPARQPAGLAAALASARQLAGVLGGLLHQLRGAFLEPASLLRAQSQSNALRTQMDSHFRQAGLTHCAE